MPFLRNTWYAAAWGDELHDRMLSRTILNEPIVLFRKRTERLSGSRTAARTDLSRSTWAVWRTISSSASITV